MADLKPHIGIDPIMGRPDRSRGVHYEPELNGCNIRDDDSDVVAEKYLGIKICNILSDYSWHDSVTKEFVLVLLQYKNMSRLLSHWRMINSKDELAGRSEDVLNKLAHEFDFEDKISELPERSELEVVSRIIADVVDIAVHDFAEVRELVTQRRAGGSVSMREAERHRMMHEPLSGRSIFDGVMPSHHEPMITEEMLRDELKKVPKPPESKSLSDEAEEHGINTVNESPDVPSANFFTKLKGVFKL